MLGSDAAASGSACQPLVASQVVEKLQLRSAQMLARLSARALKVRQPLLQPQVPQLH